MDGHYPSTSTHGSQRRWKRSRANPTRVGRSYALNRWEAFTGYCDDGRLEIENLPVERALREVPIGRRNYLFAGADSGSERAAVTYSLIGTAKFNDVDPEAYLRFVYASPTARSTELTNSCRGSLRTSSAQTPEDPARL